MEPLFTLISTFEGKKIRLSSDYPGILYEPGAREIVTKSVGDHIISSVNYALDDEIERASAEVPPPMISQFEELTTESFGFSVSDSGVITPHLSFFFPIIRLLSTYEENGHTTLLESIFEVRAIKSFMFKKIMNVFHLFINPHSLGTRVTSFTISKDKSHFNEVQKAMSLLIFNSLKLKTICRKIYNIETLDKESLDDKILNANLSSFLLRIRARDYVQLLSRLTLVSLDSSHQLLDALSKYFTTELHFKGISLVSNSRIGFILYLMRIPLHFQHKETENVVILYKENVLSLKSLRSERTIIRLDMDFMNKSFSQTSRGFSHNLASYFTDTVSRVILGDKSYSTIDFNKFYFAIQDCIKLDLFLESRSDTNISASLSNTQTPLNKLTSESSKNPTTWLTFISGLTEYSNFALALPEDSDRKAIEEAESMFKSSLYVS